MLGKLKKKLNELLITKIPGRKSETGTNKGLMVFQIRLNKKLAVQVSGTST